MKQTKAVMKSYDFGDWEGGIAVFVTDGEHGAKIVSVPRLGISTCMLRENDITAMLMQNRTMYSNPQEMDTFANMIIRDIRTA